MDILLEQVEVRVLGSLLEKSMTTPEYYPLTLNSLSTACNQKSNRNPVVAFEETTVVRALDSLKGKRLVVQGDSGRVPRYSETLVSSQNLLHKEAALLSVLMLRGPQTLGELRGRSERSYKFDSLEETEGVISDLIDTGYVIKLPRQAGRKERRYAHLFCGEPEVEVVEAKVEAATFQVRSENEKITMLVEEVESLRAELTSLKEDFSRFKSEFE